MREVRGGRTLGAGRVAEHEALVRLARRVYLRAGDRIVGQLKEQGKGMGEMAEWWGAVLIERGAAATQGTGR